MRRDCADARALLRAGAAGYPRPSRRASPSPRMRGTGAWPREPARRPGLASPGARRCPPWDPTRGVAVVALSLGLALEQEALLRHLPFLRLFGLLLGPCRRVSRPEVFRVGVRVRENLRWAFERGEEGGVQACNQRRGPCLSGRGRTPAAHRGLQGWLLEREDRLLEEVISDGERRSVKLWAVE